MLSRNRFLFASVAFLVLIGGVCGWFLAKSYRVNADASQQIAIRSLHWIWQDAQRDQLAMLGQASDALLASRPVCKAFADRNLRALAAAVDHARLPGAMPSRIIFYGATGDRLYDRQRDPHAAMLTDDALRRILAARPAGPVGGPIPWRNDRFMWVRVAPVHCGAAAGYIMVGADMDPTLTRLAAATDAGIYLVNVHGNEVMGMGAPPLGSAAHQLPIGRGAVRSPVLDGTRYETLSVPIAGPTGHTVGLVVAARPIAATLTPAERHFMLTMTALGITVVAGIACLATLVQGLSRALRRIAGVTGRLAVLDTMVRPELDDEELPGAVGQIVRHVGTIRDALIELNLLRDEQRLAWQRQEDLIRTQLRHLSQRLDDETRGKVMRELEHAGDASAGNRLLALSGTLSRLTGHIATQQERVVQLLRELAQSVEARTALAGLRRELAIARDIQQSILPRTPPDTPAVHVTARMLPANEIGGDFYAWTLIDEHHLAIDIGDVSGKGIAAALFMTLVRTLLGGAAAHVQSPARAVRALNARLAADNDQQMFVTLFRGILDMRTGRLAYANCGHPPPALCSATDLAFLPGQGNPALGVVDDYAFQETEVTLAPGDALFLYTDGITEAFDAQGRLFGRERLARVLGDALPEHAPSGLPARVVEAVRAFEDSLAPTDDIACVNLVWLGASGASQTQSGNDWNQSTSTVT